MTLNDLKIDHDYYCSESNYYSHKPKGNWSTFQDFFNEFQDADVDMNLIFRWDIKTRDNGQDYMEIFMIHQRKGIFAPHYIESVSESDVENIVKLLQPHLDKLTKNWLPLIPATPIEAASFPKQ